MRFKNLYIEGTDEYTVFERGYDAYNWGVSINQCPYENKSHLYNCWLEGWDAADVDYRTNLMIRRLQINNQYKDKLG